MHYLVSYPNFPPGSGRGAVGETLYCFARGVTYRSILSAFGLQHPRCTWEIQGCEEFSVVYQPFIHQVSFIMPEQIKCAHSFCRPVLFFVSCDFLFIFQPKVLPPSDIDRFPANRQTQCVCRLFKTTYQSVYS